VTVDQAWDLEPALRYPGSQELQHRSLMRNLGSALPGRAFGDERSVSAQAKNQKWCLVIAPIRDEHDVDFAFCGQSVDDPGEWPGAGAERREADAGK